GVWEAGGPAEPGQVAVGDRRIVDHPRPRVVREYGQPSGEALVVFELHAVITRTGGIWIGSADAVILRHVPQQPVSLNRPAIQIDGPGMRDDVVEWSGHGRLQL